MEPKSSAKGSQLADMAIFRERASVLCIDNNRLLALRHSSPEHGDFWGVPGGAIEPGETPLQAALRETGEETGYITELVCDPEKVSEYEFTWGGHVYQCRTHWFVVRPVPCAPHSPRAGDVEFITELRWMPMNEWPTLFGGHEVLVREIGRIIDFLVERQLLVGAASHQSKRVNGVECE